MTVVVLTGLIFFFFFFCTTEIPASAVRSSGQTVFTKSNRGHGVTIRFDDSFDDSPVLGGISVVRGSNPLGVIPAEDWRPGGDISVNLHGGRVCTGTAGRTEEKGEAREVRRAVPRREGRHEKP